MTDYANAMTKVLITGGTRMLEGSRQDQIIIARSVHYGKNVSVGEECILMQEHVR